MAYIANAKIYVVQASADALDEMDLGDRLSGEYIRGAMEDVLSGERVFLRRQYSEGFDAQVLFAAYPWDDGAGGNPRRDPAVLPRGEHIGHRCKHSPRHLDNGGGIPADRRPRHLPRHAPHRTAHQIPRRRRRAGWRAAKPRTTSKRAANDETGRLARSFNSMKHKLQQNEALRQELIAGISHDLRTPVTSINGYLSGITEGVIKPEDYPKYLGIIRQETQRLMRLTDEILEDGQDPLGQHRAQPAAALRWHEAADAAADPPTRRWPRRKHIRIDTAYRPLPHGARRYAQKVEQVFYNLAGQRRQVFRRGRRGRRSLPTMRENAVHVVRGGIRGRASTPKACRIYSTATTARSPRERSKVSESGSPPSNRTWRRTEDESKRRAKPDTERASASRCPINVYKLLTL